MPSSASSSTALHPLSLHDALPILKTSQVTFADLFLIRSHAANVVRVLFHNVCIKIVEQTAHFVGMFLVHAKDDGLVVSVGLLKEVRQVLCNSFGTRTERKTLFEISCVVFLVRNFAAVFVELAFGWTPPRGVC